MEWLRCNKCYRGMKGAKRSFSLTQCGHMFCSLCMSQITKNCPECGSQDLGTMPLSYPPKFETTHNYFSHLDDFMTVCQKNAQFQENQLSVATRGFELTEKKYEAFKRSYWTAMKEQESLAQAFQKLQIETKELKKTRDSLLKRREARSVSSAQSSRSSQQSQHVQGRLSTPNQLARASGIPCQSEGRSLRRPSSNTFAMKETRETPKQAYNKNSPFSNGTSDGHTTRESPAFTSGFSGYSSGVFLVPNNHKVPKSAASLRRVTPEKPKSKESSQYHS